MTQDTIEQVIATLTFNESGLIPAIAQEATSKDVLMMAWMNADAVRETLETGRVCYFSRSRGKLWRKGRDVSLAAFEKLYQILGTKFDYYFFESETSDAGIRLVRDGVAKGIFEESEGAVQQRGDQCIDGFALCHTAVQQGVKVGCVRLVESC